MTVVGFARGAKHALKCGQVPAVPTSAAASAALFAVAPWCVPHGPARRSRFALQAAFR